MQFKNSYLWKALSRHSRPLNLKDWSSLTLLLSILTIPFQISAVLWETPNWGRGFFNPYASVELYLFELFIILSSILFFLHHWRNKKMIKNGHLNYYTLILCWWFLIIFSLTYQTTEPSFALALIAHSSVFILLYFLIVNRVTSVRSIIIIFVASMSFQALLAILQFSFQSNIGFHFLGEPVLQVDAAHVSKLNIGQNEYIRSYGTLSHPNVLGGFLSLSMISTFFLTIKKSWLKPALLFLQFLGLLVTFSRSALISLSIALIFMAMLYKKELQQHSKLLVNGIASLVLLELLIVLWLRVDELSQSTIGRFQGFRDTLAMFDLYPLGVGFQTYTLKLDEVSQMSLMPWDYQPVHNIFLLMLAELGIFGLLLGAWFILFTILKLHERRMTLLTKQRLKKKRLLLCAMVIIALIGFFDHYWISLHQGLALLTLFFGLASAFSLDPINVTAIKKGAVLKKNQIDLTESL